MSDISPIQTLIDLGHALIEDEAYAEIIGQAQPVVYGIIEPHKVIAPKGYADDWKLYATDDEDLTTPIDAKQALLDYLDGGDMLVHDDELDLFNRANAVAQFTPIVIEHDPSDEDATHEAIRKLKAHVKVHPTLAQTVLTELGLAHVFYYRNTETLKKGPFALTHNGILAYLDADAHNCAHGAKTYAMTATKCDEITSLISALKTLARDTDRRVGICPECNVETEFDLEIIETDDDPNIFKVCTCHECGTTWTETYTHVNTTRKDTDE